MEGEDREQRPRLAAADVEGAPVDVRLQGSENADVHLWFLGASLRRGDRRIHRPLPELVAELYRTRPMCRAMNTSLTTCRRHVRRGALALAVSAICLPSGVAVAAGDTKYDYPGTQHPVAPKVGDTSSDFPGMRDGPTVSELVVSDGPEATGFDWTSAAIGAGGAGLLLVVSLGGATYASRVRIRAARP
jgi:hypothetical protein